MILLDFDASQSIVLTGNGRYQLKPVIRTIETAITGSIKGSISTTGKILTVTATSNGVSYSSVTNLSGAFLISGLPAGTYEITVTPALPLLPVTIPGCSSILPNTVSIICINLMNKPHFYGHFYVVSYRPEYLVRISDFLYHRFRPVETQMVYYH